MVGIGLMELILVAILFAGGIFGIFALSRGLRGFRLGHATLDCPHCGKETPVSDGKCRACGQSFT